MHRVSLSWASQKSIEGGTTNAEALLPNAWETFGQPVSKRQRCRLESESSTIKKSGRVNWTTDDLIKAGGLLAQPPLDIQFPNEQEMRRVFSLVYDVLRCK